MKEIANLNIPKHIIKNHEMKEENLKISKGMKKFVVEEIRVKKNGLINPVIVAFQNGELNDHCTSKFDINFSAHKNGETKIEVKTSYGHVFKDSYNSEKPRLKQIIAIRNRKTNKVKLVEVDSATLINSALLTSSKICETMADYGKEVRALNRTFGSKKILGRLEQREKLNLTLLPITEDMKKTVEDIIVEENSLLCDTETNSIIDLLPPCHRDTKILSNVYVISEIISEQELEALKQEVRKLEENKFNLKHFSPFFLNCYTEAKKLEQNLDSKLAGILFLECLIKFLRMPSKKLTSKGEDFCPFSSVIHEKILNEFCIKTDASISRPLTLRDKTLCYIITLCLISCNYQINLKLLSTTTGIHLNRLTRLARVVGAVPETKDEHVFVLKLPLPALPRASRGRTRRK